MGMLVALRGEIFNGQKTTPSEMITKMIKWLIDVNSNLSPEEKLEQKLMVNEQIEDPIDREAENQCDWVDYRREKVDNYVKNNVRSPLIAQFGLIWLNGEAEAQKYNIRQQAEYAKRQRDEQERVRCLLSIAVSRQPMFYFCSDRFT